MCKKESYVVSTTIVMAIAVMMFFPVMGTAGSLEPSAAPAPTMKTLDQIPPTWSQKLPAAQRFELVLDGAAVLDKETGLVWEQSPLTTSNNQWAMANFACMDLTVGGRKGWHLPTIEQLASLTDPTATSTIKLPAGHPFGTDCSTGRCVQPAVYWSATTGYAFSTSASVVDFSTGNALGGGVKDTAYYNIWCVRGGQSNNAY